MFLNSGITCLQITTITRLTILSPNLGFILGGQPPKHTHVPPTHITVLYTKKEIRTSVGFEVLTAVTTTITISLDDTTMYFGT